jgi:hypothetical protein
MIICHTFAGVLHYWLVISLIKQAAQSRPLAQAKKSWLPQVLGSQVPVRSCRVCHLLTLQKILSGISSFLSKVPGTIPLCHVSYCFLVVWPGTNSTKQQLDVGPAYGCAGPCVRPPSHPLQNGSTWPIPLVQGQMQVHHPTSNSISNRAFYMRKSLYRL